MEKLLKCPIIGCIGTIFGSISMISTLIVISIYIFNKSMRNFTYRIVVYLQISDFLLSFSIIMMGAQNFFSNYSAFFCKTQAFILNYGVVATAFWTFMITLIMLQSLRLSLICLKKYEKFYVAIGFLCPLIFTIMLLFFKKFV